MKCTQSASSSGRNSLIRTMPHSVGKLVQPLAPDPWRGREGFSRDIEFANRPPRLGPGITGQLSRTTDSPRRDATIAVVRGEAANKTVGVGLTTHELTCLCRCHRSNLLALPQLVFVFGLFQQLNSNQCDRLAQKVNTHGYWAESLFQPKLRINSPHPR